LTLIERAALSSLDNFGKSKRKISLRNMFRGSVPSPDGFRDGWYVMSRNSTHSGHPRMEPYPNPREILLIEPSSDDFARKWGRLYHLADESQRRQLLKQQADFDEELAGGVGSSQSNRQSAQAGAPTTPLKRKEKPLKRIQASEPEEQNMASRQQRKKGRS